MKLLTGLAAGLLLTLISVQPVIAQSPPVTAYDDKVIIPGQIGGEVICMNDWIPPREGNSIGDSTPGICKGDAVSAIGLAAISASNSAETLEQIRVLLDQINRTLAANGKLLNDIQQFLKTQNHPEGESLDRSIERDIDALSRKILNNDEFRKAIEKLKEDIANELAKGTK